MQKSPHSILIVEDSVLDREFLALHLADAGYTVLQSDDGSEIEDLLERGQIDLLLLDVVLPGIDGLSILSKLRLKHTAIGLPVIMLTSRGDSVDVVKGLSLGANDYVTKPADMEVLLARVSTHLSLKNAKESLRESEERFSLAVSGANDGIWDWNLSNNEVYYSPRWKSQLGYGDHEFPNSPEGWYKSIHSEDLAQVQEAIKFHVDAMNDHLEIEYRMINKNGECRWMLTRGLAVRDKKGKAYRIAGSQTDITDNKLTDALSGLPNRALFMDRLIQVHKALRRRPEASFGVCILNIDRFTIVNESMGQAIGDKLLQEFSRRLLECLRPDDTLARFGGDEFLVLLEGLPNTEEVSRFMERVATKLAVPFKLGGKEFMITVGAGIVFGTLGYLNAEDMVRDAQTALHRAKAKGVSNFEIFDPTMHALVVRRFQMETELRNAIEQEQFYLNYQPIVSSEGKQAGYEALVRWKHPTQGVVLPDEFIPIAEETGMIVPLGEVILRTACVAVKGLQQKGLGEHFVAVNVSGRQFQQKNLIDMIDRIMKISDFQPTLLKIELTESILMENIDETIAKLKRMRDLGMHILVDDFGTGYSSLAYLKKFPITALKIDKSFVSDLETDPGAASIVRVIIAMAHNLNLEVIAEGVETENQYQFLKSNGCDSMQGHLFSIPLPIEELELFLKSSPSGSAVWAR